MKNHKSERGQALAETALFGILAVMMAFGLLAWIPVHRARTAATAAAYACSQFLSQSPNTRRAAANARQVAWKTLDATWSATRAVEYKVAVIAPPGPGQPGRCSVSFQAPTLFNGLLQMGAGGWSQEWFISRSETWKARWR
jgi:hypothetical protein